MTESPPSLHASRSCVIRVGLVSPIEWGPPNLARHQVLWHGDGVGNPHGQHTDPALLRIGVDEALSACRRAMEIAARCLRWEAKGRTTGEKERNFRLRSHAFGWETL
jgi:hypothetical protein